MVNVIIRRSIYRPRFGRFPREQSQIHYDSKAKRSKKMHCLTYQQGRQYGEVGDMCDYLSHDELLFLEREGFISISGMQRKERSKA